MPRNGSGVYSADWVDATPNTTIESAKQNAMIDDLVADANAARPITAGGTAGVTAIEGADNLSTKGSNIASATTTDIGAATGRFVHITGTTTITGLGTKTAGVVRFVTFDGVLTLTHNGTSLILPGGANIVTADGDTAIFVSEGSGNWRCLAYTFAASRAVRVIRTQVFTATGTYTPHANMVFAIVEAQAPGAGGGGVSGAATGGRGGGGGGSGGYSKKTVTRADVGASQAVTIGTVGSGNTGADGSDGGNVSLGTLCTANGGKKGLLNAGNSGAEGSALATAGTGDLALQGNPGSAAASATVTTGLILGGNGAASFFGSGGFGARSGQGGTAVAWGAGGGGAAATSDNTSYAGGSGGPGRIIVTEFCSE